MQKTKFNKILSSIGYYISLILIGSWRKRSIGVLFILFGFYLGSNLTVYFLETIDRRPLIVIFMLVFIEFLIRIRSRVKEELMPIQWVAIDNLRIGLTYSVVLEAFKLGS